MKINTETAKIAEALHKSLCTWNHTDGCGWMYDDFDKVDERDQYNPRLRYYKKAQELIELVGVEKALIIAKTITANAY